MKSLNKGFHELIREVTSWRHVYNQDNMTDPPLYREKIIYQSCFFPKENKYLNKISKMQHIQSIEFFKRTAEIWFTDKEDVFENGSPRFRLRI